MGFFYTAFLGRTTSKSVRDADGQIPAQTLYKQANLGFHSKTGEIVITPLFHCRDGVSVNADAICALSFVPHKAPSRACSCGFYAYADRNEAEAHEQKGTILLKVVASGKLLEYRRGYRYEHQRVEEVEVTECAWCHKSAHRFLIHGNVITPACLQHSNKMNGNKVLSFEKFERLASETLPSHAPRITIKSPNRITSKPSNGIRKETMMTIGTMLIGASGILYSALKK